MSKSTLKRRSSSVSDSTNHHQTKRRRSSSQQGKSSNPNPNHPSSRSAPERPKQLQGWASQFVQKIASLMSSNTPQVDPELFQTNPQGSLAMLQSFDKPPSSSSQIPNGHDAGSSSANPIDVSELDDDAEIPSSSKPKNRRRSVSPKKPEINGIAGPSLQKTPLLPDLSLNLFPETFSQSASQNKSSTSPDSQNIKEAQQKPSPPKRQSSAGATALDQPYPTPPDSQKVETTSQKQSSFDEYTFEHNDNKHSASLGHLKKQISRPNINIDVDHTPRPKKGWERRGPSPDSSASGSTSSISSRSIRGTPKRKMYRSNIRKKKDIEITERKVETLLNALAEYEVAKGDKQAGASSKRVAKMFGGDIHSIGKATEYAVKRISSKGANTKEVYGALLKSLATKSPTLEDKTTTPRSLFDISGKQETGRSARTKAGAIGHDKYFNLDSVLTNLKQIEKEEKAKEAEIKEKLKAKKPKVPKTLNPEQEAQVTAHLKDPAFKSRVSTAECEAKSIQRLKNGTWLDDEIMNFYIALMDERAKEKGTLKLHTFNSFFYQRLSETGYSAVKRWTKKIDIFSKDLVIFPVNIGNMHWTACAINLKEKRVEYYDSMGDYSGHRNGIFRRVRGYLNDEHQERKKTPFDFTGWTEEFNDNTPQQDNGSDCGVFSCQTLEMITRGRDLKNQPFEFASENMPFFRRLMVWEIANRKLEKRTWGSPAL